MVQLKSDQHVTSFCASDKCANVFLSAATNRLAATPDDYAKFHAITHLVTLLHPQLRNTQ